MKFCKGKDMPHTMNTRWSTSSSPCRVGNNSLSGTLQLFSSYAGIRPVRSTSSAASPFFQPSGRGKAASALSAVAFFFAGRDIIMRKGATKIDCSEEATRWLQWRECERKKKKWGGVNHSPIVCPYIGRGGEPFGPTVHYRWHQIALPLASNHPPRGSKSWHQWLPRTLPMQKSRHHHHGLASRAPHPVDCSGSSRPVQSLHGDQGIIISGQHPGCHVHSTTALNARSRCDTMVKIPLDCVGA